MVMSTTAQEKPLDPVEVLITILSSGVDTCKKALGIRRACVLEIQGEAIGNTYGDGGQGDGSVLISLLEENRVNARSAEARLKKAEWRIRQLLRFKCVPCEHPGCLKPMEDERVTNLATENLCAEHARLFFKSKKGFRRVA